MLTTPSRWVLPFLLSEFGSFFLRLSLFLKELPTSIEYLYRRSAPWSIKSIPMKIHNAVYLTQTYICCPNNIKFHELIESGTESSPQQVHVFLLSESHQPQAVKTLMTFNEKEQIELPENSFLSNLQHSLTKRKTNIASFILLTGISLCTCDSESSRWTTFWTKHILHEEQNKKSTS